MGQGPRTDGAMANRLLVDPQRRSAVLAALDRRRRGRRLRASPAVRCRHARPVGLERVDAHRGSAPAPRRVNAAEPVSKASVQSSMFGATELGRQLVLADVGRPGRGHRHGLRLLRRREQLRPRDRARPPAPRPRRTTATSRPTTTTSWCTPRPGVRLRGHGLDRRERRVPERRREPGRDRARARAQPRADARGRVRRAEPRRCRPVASSTTATPPT